MTQPVVLWSRLPPPEGGVTVSAVRVAAALAERGDLAGVVDFGDPRSWTAARGRGHQHLFWCSTPRAASRHGRLARFAPGPRHLFVHGGDPAAGEARRWKKPPFETIFASNTMLADDLRGTGLGRDVVVASPWVPPTPSETAPQRGGIGARPVDDGPPTRVLVGVGANPRWYGLDTAVDAIAMLRDRHGRDTTLTVMGPVPEREAEKLPPWADALGPVPEADVAELLADHDLLLRPSRTDGDSLLVRDALYAGLRVVASDVVPRPAGVEVAANTAAALAAAVVTCDRVSEGAGTGPPLLELL